MLQENETVLFYSHVHEASFSNLMAVSQKSSPLCKHHFLASSSHLQAIAFVQIPYNFASFHIFQLNLDVWCKYIFSICLKCCSVYCWWQHMHQNSTIYNIQICRCNHIGNSVRCSRHGIRSAFVPSLNSR